MGGVYHLSFGTNLLDYIIYGALLAEYLFDQGIPISVVNPARTKGFSQSELSHTKNDKSDASLIARFSAAMKPSLWAPQPINVRH
jgi:transposase